MPLIDRLAGIGPDPEQVDKLPVDTFYCCMLELAEGQVTKAQIVSYFSLDAGEETELDWIIAQYQAALDKPKYLEVLRTCFVLAESQIPLYDSNAEITARLTVV